jgi:NAD+ synthase
MDLLWYAFKNEYEPEEVGSVMGKTAEEIKKVFAGFERKIKTTEYLRMSPISF